MSTDSPFLNNRFYKHNTIWEYPCFKRVYAMLVDHVNIESADNILYSYREVHADVKGQVLPYDTVLAYFYWRSYIFGPIKSLSL